jgi:deoxyadenosine/deoxycytidine kinase
MYNYITIEGNIGAGKTSLANRLAAELNARLILEQFDENPFLPKFYEDPLQFAFPLELSFLASRFQQLTDQLPQQELFSSFTVSDYFIHKSLIFAQKTIQGDELILFRRLFDIMAAHLPKPELLVYLHLNTSRLLWNIQYRGRGYEQQMTEAYLKEIQESYFEFFRQHPEMRVLIIDTNRIDFVHCDADYERVLGLITKEYPEGITRRSFF